MADFIFTYVLSCIFQYLAYKHVLLYNQRKGNNTFLNLKRVQKVKWESIFSKEY